MRKMMCSWCEASARATKGETCADQMTDSLSGAQRCYAILEPSACDAFRACEETVLDSCMCIVSGCPVYTPPSIFWNSFQETEITTISQMM